MVPTRNVYVAGFIVVGGPYPITRISIRIQTSKQVNLPLAAKRAAALNENFLIKCYTTFTHCVIMNKVRKECYVMERLDMMINKELKAALSKQAKELGLSLSAYIRMTLAQTVSK